MSIGQASVSNPKVPLGNEGLIKVMDHFKYLGAFCSANGTNVKELNSRIGNASAAFRELDKVWRDRNINLDIKLKFYNACVLSTLPHSCMHVSAGHSLSMMRPDLMPLTCTASARSYGLYGPSILQTVPIRYRTKQPQLTAVIRKCSLQWFGNLQQMNMDHIRNTLHHWKPSHGKRRPDWPNTSWWEVIQKDISKMDLRWTVEGAEVAAR